MVSLLTVGAIYISGDYPTGSDTMCHIYKGNALYQMIKEGNWYPLYDDFWYNGGQMMRYWAPLPVYFLALCQALAGGSELGGYLVFVGLILFLGAAVWLYIGSRKNRFWFGAFLGILWFFLPNNLFALFVEGNLPRSLSMVLLPLFIYSAYEFLFEDNWKELCRLIPVFTGILLCHVGYGGMLALAMLVFLLVYRIIYRKKGYCLTLIAGMLLPFLIIGIWLYASLKGGITSTDSSQVMQGFFQKAVISLNPVRRLTDGVVDFYFGLAAFGIAVFGSVCSKRKSMVGFITAVIIFICTTKAMYPLMMKLPGSQYLWMLRFISIALCMILYSFLLWKTLRRWIFIVCCCLLVADVLPSLSLVYKGTGEQTAQQRLEAQAENTLITKARQITKQRVALMDLSTLGATGPYLLTDYNGAKVAQTFGAGWQSAATAPNIVQLNAALSQGYYIYLFDRALELGNDTVLIRIDQLKNKAEDIPQVTKSAGKIGYKLTDKNEDYLLYHMDTYATFGTVCQYNGIGIGSSASMMALPDPDIEEGDSDNLNDYSFEELLQYKVIYLAGFTYDDKEQAEKMLQRLADRGVRIVISGDGIPVNKTTQNQEFLGVTCHPVVFENGYPILNSGEKEYDCQYFDKEYRNWKTVYFSGLQKTTGYLYDNGTKVDFLGTTYNDNICFVGLNLSYHYVLTKDEVAQELLRPVWGDELREKPDRTVIEYSITRSGQTITIRSANRGLNTSLAYQDIFYSKQKLSCKRQLLYVDKGETVIHMRYPYLKEGIAMSVAGIVLTGVYILFVKRRYGQRTEPEGEGTEG